eukprot:4260-Eustigmatos_ZCMA.PRE.1
MLAWLEIQNEVYYRPLIDEADEVNELLRKVDECRNEVRRLQYTSGGDKVEREARVKEGQAEKYFEQAR